MQQEINTAEHRLSLVKKKMPSVLLLKIMPTKTLVILIIRNWDRVKS